MLYPYIREKQRDGERERERERGNRHEKAEKRKRRGDGDHSCHEWNAGEKRNGKKVQQTHRRIQLQLKDASVLRESVKTQQKSGGLKVEQCNEKTERETKGRGPVVANNVGSERRAKRHHER